MARRRIVTVLVAAAVIGGAGGYGAGLATMPDDAGRSDDRSLQLPSPSTGRTSTTTPSPVVVKKPVPDRTRGLVAGDLEYATKKFDARKTTFSEVSVRVPFDWDLTRPEPDEGRYTDPLRKRWIRVEAGFLPTQPPASSMQNRIEALANVSADQDLRILSRSTGSGEHVTGIPLRFATLVYTYIPDKTIRRVLVRWISFGDQDLTTVEISVIGLPQDEKALNAVLERATETVVREDHKR